MIAPLSAKGTEMIGRGRLCPSVVSRALRAGAVLAFFLAPLYVADGGIGVAEAAVSAVKIVSPTAGETLDWGTTRRIVWESIDLGSRAHSTLIALSLDDGVTWKPLAVLDGNPGGYDWRVHEVPGLKRCSRLRVVIVDERGSVIARGRSAGRFAIRGTVSLYGLGSAEGWYVKNLQLGKAAAGDLDGDSRVEIAALAFEGGHCFTVEIMRREANKTLPFVTTLSTFGLLDLKALVVADLNGDGRDDLAFSAVSTLGGGMLARVLVLYQDPVTGEIGANSAQRVLASDRVGDLVAGDFNGDGRTDLAVLTEPTFSGGSGAVALFFQSPTGVLRDEVRYDDSPVLLDGAIGAGDLDGDGRTDLVVQSGPRELAMLLQDPLVPQTGFAPPRFAPVGGEGSPAVAHFAVGDLNNDGADDVAVIAGAKLRLFRRGNAGDFPETAAIALAAGPRRVAIADHDGDRLNDILIDWPKSLGVLRQTCSHTFRLPLYRSYCFTTPVEPDLPGSLFQADVNGDAVPDTVISGVRGDLTFVFGTSLR